MAKKAAKPAPAASPDDGTAKPKRSKIKLVLFILVPLVLLGGGGYGAWAYFLAPAPEVHHAEETHEAPKHGDVDPVKVAALKAEAAAETSATYNYALAQMLKTPCGGLKVEALKTAAEAEAAHDGMLVHMSWQAALRRAGTITGKSCNRILAEIDKAELALEGGGAAADGHGEKAGGHGEAAGGHDAKPAAH